MVVLAWGGGGDQTEIAGVERVMDPGTDSPAHESGQRDREQFCVGSEVATLTDMCRESGPLRRWMPRSGWPTLSGPDWD